jgi:hypothetical protein
MVQVVEFTLWISTSRNRVEAIKNIRTATGFGLHQSRMIYDMAERDWWSAAHDA